ncbi:MAG: metalloregulator ArsR/SmtB family transcription factor [Bacteroidota bacterium]
MTAYSDLDHLVRPAETLRAIAHPIRLAIIDLLHQNQQMSVTEIYEHLDIQQAVASHHLKILKDKYVVKVKRDGKSSLYSLKSDEYYQIFARITDLA